jgi:hypothetical protein
MHNIIADFQKKLQIMIYEHYMKTLRIIPIENHKGTRFYLRVSANDTSGRISVAFLAPNFGHITYNKEKYDVFHRQFVEMDYKITHWGRYKSRKFPFRRNLSLVEEYLASEEGKKHVPKVPFDYKK